MVAPGQVVLEELLIKVLRWYSHIGGQESELEVEVLQQLEQMVHHQEVEWWRWIASLSQVHQY